LRENNINSEIYPESAKMKKQFEYADKKNIPFVMILGTDEMHKSKYQVRDMKSGEQLLLEFENLIQYFNAKK
jgi:histidyl-tRNA synthetase